jgi:hypothetical protein
LNFDPAGEPLHQRFGAVELFANITLPRTVGARTRSVVEAHGARRSRIEKQI